MKIILSIIFAFIFFSAKSQCKLRIINKTQSSITVEVKRLNISSTLNPGDTSSYYSVDSLQKKEKYTLVIDGSKIMLDQEKNTGYIKSGLWEIIFRWSDRRQMFFTILNQELE